MAKQSTIKLKGFAHALCDRLVAEGFHVLYYDSVTTNSTYIKMDYGVAKSVRIGDHRGKKHLKYTFNVGTHIVKNHKQNGRYYYSVDDEQTLNRLVEDICEMRDEVKRTYGEELYLRFYRENKAAASHRKGFWQFASEWDGSSDNDERLLSMGSYVRGRGVSRESIWKEIMSR